VAVVVAVAAAVGSWQSAIVIHRTLNAKPESGTKNSIQKFFNLQVRY